MHRSGICRDTFATSDELEEHFETVHFHYTRLNPAHRYICSRCHFINSKVGSCCQRCKAHGEMETRIFGKLFRSASHEQDSDELMPDCNMCPKFSTTEQMIKFE